MFGFMFRMQRAANQAKQAALRPLPKREKPQPVVRLPDCGLDYTKLVTYACSGCSRSFTRQLGEIIEAVRRGRTSCQLCGGSFSLPEEVTVALRAVHEALAKRA